MSRIGRRPITIPAGVTVTLVGRDIKVAGPKGNAELTLPKNLGLEIEGAVATIKLQKTTDQTQKLFGLTRTLLNNAIAGSAEGFSKQLEINGVGYRASVAGRNLNLSLGFSHPIEFGLPEHIEAKVEKNIVTISGHDKQLVGQVAADIRALKKPEPYKGKGIRYVGEHVRRKAGKTAAKAV